MLPTYGYKIFDIIVKYIHDLICGMYYLDYKFKQSEQKFDPKLLYYRKHILYYLRLFYSTGLITEFNAVYSQLRYTSLINYFIKYFETWCSYTNFYFYLINFTNLKALRIIYEPYII